MKRVRRLLGSAIVLMAVLVILGPFSSHLVAGPAAGASSDGECLGQFDTDEDGFIDCVDNCPVLVNDQTDSDADGIGDACDCDVDIDTTDDGDDGECIIDCTFREAIDVAPGGCAIRVPAGLYSLAADPVVIDRPVTLLGDGAVTTVLDAPGGGLEIRGEAVLAGDVFLQGVTIARAGISVLSNLDISTLYLSNSVVRDGLTYGIGIGHVTVDHCLITGNGSTMDLGGGIFLGGSASDPASVFVNDSVVSGSEDPCPEDPDFDGDGFGQFGTCHPLDCDDANPNCTSVCTDSDGDGYCVTSDCDDLKPHCALICIDNDFDGYCGDQDCNERFGGCTTECIDDDGDGLPVCAGDCDDDNQFCGLDCTDTDGDGYCDEFDCDESDPVCNFRCHDSSDGDLDGVPGSCDNCPVTYNPSQRDSDGDGAGDICDVCAAHPEFTYPSFTHLFDFSGNGYGNINGLATDSSGKIYLGDAWSQTIGVYSPAGLFIFHLAGPFGPGWVGAVFGLAVGPTGRVHSADNGNWDVDVYQEDGTFLFSFSTPDQPVDVAVGGDGRIYYTLPERPGVFFRDEAGGPGGVIGSAGVGAGQYRKPWGVAVDDADNVYVTDWLLDIVMVYDSSGDYVRSLTGAFDDPVDVVVDAAGNVYVADWGNERVVVFNAAGVYQTHFSTPGPPGGGVAAGLNAVALSPEENILVNFRTGDALVRVYSRLIPDDPCPSDCVDFDADGVFDCDGDCGVVPCGDCDGSNPYCGLDCTDADTDDYCADFDCDDGNPMCLSDCTDIDLDDYCVTTDCDDTLDWLWAPPGPAGGLAFDANTSEWSWDAPLDPGGLFWTYDVIRSEDPTDFLGVAHCVATDVEDAVAEDTLAPPPGHGYYYLVRARNDCDDGSLGENSSGNARPAGRPCP